MSETSANDDFQEEGTPKTIKITQRNRLLKLELTDSLPKNLVKIASTLYNVKIKPTRKAVNSKVWATTDGLMLEAKKSYDEIIDAFNSEPKVYKFASTKEKIWSVNAASNATSMDIDNGSINSITTGHSLISSASRPLSISSKQHSIHSNPTSQQITHVDERHVTNSKSLDVKNSILDEEASRHSLSSGMSQQGKELTIDEQITTYLDPFALVAPGSHVEVWKDKLNLLDKITPREDLDGYEYREDYFEQRYRLGIQTDFQRRMKEEIFRREHHPTDIEQVEDVLYDIVEAIASRQGRWVMN